MISKVYINDPRQIKPSLVPKYSAYQDVLLDCSEWSINVTSTLFVLLSLKQYISSSLKASYSSSTVGLELGSLKAGVLSALISSLDWQATSLVLSVDFYMGKLFHNSANCYNSEQRDKPTSLCSKFIASRKPQQDSRSIKIADVYTSHLIKSRSLTSSLWSNCGGL